MPLTVHTDGYRASHGRQPRGRGVWAFGPERDPDIGAVYFVREPLTYGEAKRVALREGRLRGWAEVWVQP